jgi:putative aldouronate transport system substrate-binding protein
MPWQFLYRNDSLLKVNVWGYSYKKFKRGVKMRKKYLSVMTVCILILSVLVACTSTPSDKKSETTTTEPTAEVKSPEPTVAATPVAAKINEFGWEVPDKTIDITFYAGQDNPDKTKEKGATLHKFLLDNFNVNLNKIVYDMDIDEKLNLMLASGDYPEVITGLNDTQVSKWVSQGKAIEIGNLIDKAGPNVKSQLGDVYKYFKDTSGKVYSLPVYWGILPIPDYSAHIRYDWWVEMGSPKYDTPDAYFDLLKKMQAAHPKNAKGEKTYAISGMAPLMRTVLPTLAGVWGLKGGYKVAEDGTMTSWVNTPEGLELTKYMNRFNLAGLMDPDIVTNKYDDWKAKFSAERILGHFGAWWVTWDSGHLIWQKTNPDWKEENRFLQVAVKAPTAEKAYYSGKDARGSTRTIITDKAKNPEEIMKWFNFSITDVGTRIIGWGPPNLADSVWTFKDGKPAWNEADKQAMINDVFDSGTKSITLSMDVYPLVESQGTMKDDGKSTYWYDQNFNEDGKWKKLMNDNMKDTIYDNTFGNISIPGNDPLAITNKQVTDLMETLWAKAILSKTEEEAVANFNKMREKLNASGLKDIEKYRTTEYQRRLKEWK